ncbi:MAG: hypothetical protein LBD90_04690 [Bifidobacteriaceae bacterium]|jgi:antitoxin CcdA|nr:hypothetical protein [Bifidobacteriaceae bacterium]
MRQKKERRTLTLDADVIASFDQSNLSGEVNRVLTEEIVRRERRAGLALLLAELESEVGPPDAALVERYRQALQ